MNCKHIAIIALVIMLACIVPASAIWSNGNWVADDKKDEYFGNAEVKYDPTTGVTSKYNAPEDVNLMTYQGMIIGHLRSGGAQDGGARFLFHRVGTPENETLVQYFGPDGQYTGYLIPGEYDVILPQGTGSACGVYSDDWGYVGNPHEERTKITVVAGQRTYFDFIGNSIPSYRGEPLDASINAFLGNGDVHLDWIKLVKTGEHQYTPPCYYVTVTDVPAWDETVVDSAAWDETVIDTPAYDEFVPAVTHIVHHDAVTHQDYQNGHVHAKQVGSMSPHDFHYNSHKYQITGNSHDGAFMVTGDNGTPATLVTIIDSPAYDETVVDVPAHTVHHDAVTHVVHHPASTHVVHHPAVTHQQQVCPGPVTIPEYGFEYQIDITGAHVDASNPNREPVDIQFSFDLNYFVDLRPWDNIVDDGRVVPRTMTYNGKLTNVKPGETQYHGFLHPAVGNAVVVFDWQNGLQYAPSIGNSKVTSTVWSY